MKLMHWMFYSYLMWFQYIAWLSTGLLISVYTYFGPVPQVVLGDRNMNYDVSSNILTV